MREVIITDLTRFSTDEHVCTAAIDVHTGECFRPMPYLKGEKCRELGIHPGAILKGSIDFIGNPPNPHIEDANYGDLKYCGPSSGEKFKEVLSNSLCASLSDGFGIQFPTGQKHIPYGQQANCSIITIKVDPNHLDIHEDKYKPGKIKASFTDESGQSFRYLSITDRGYYDYAMAHQNDGKLDEVISFIGNQEEIYLRIGLSRRFQSPDGRDGYWLQVNGIYTFPYFYEAIRSYE